MTPVPSRALVSRRGQERRRGTQVDWRVDVELLRDRGIVHLHDLRVLHCSHGGRDRSKDRGVEDIAAERRGKRGGGALTELRLDGYLARDANPQALSKLTRR